MPSAQPVRLDNCLLLDKIAVVGMAEVYRVKLVGEKGGEKSMVLKKMLPHLNNEEDQGRYISVVLGCCSYRLFSLF